MSQQGSNSGERRGSTPLTPESTEEDVRREEEEASRKLAEQIFQEEATGESDV
jgi:hypothetical protein